MSANPDKIILLVDDEEMTLKYFVKGFSGDFNVLTAASVNDALAVLKREGERIAVVISDQRMPGASGVELLAWVAANRPDVVRILATAYAENEATVSAVNTGSIYRYVHKPWDVKELRQTLLRALDLHQLRRERDLLLTEKLSTLRRLVVADRVRSYAMLAGGLANRIHNSVQALRAFLESVPPASASQGEGGQVQWNDLWTMAQREGQRVVEVVQGVIDRTIEPAEAFAAVDAAALVRRTFADAELMIADRLPAVAVDAHRLERLLGILAGRMRQAEPTGQGLSVRLEAAEVWGTPGLRLLLLASASEWGPDQLRSCFAPLSPRPTRSEDAGESDLLAAFFIAYHHGGNLIVHRQRPHGPGFELLLPLDPALARIPEADPLWSERIFTAYDA
jgi:two-component system probable response regulator PhcQ